MTIKYSLGTFDDNFIYLHDVKCAIISLDLLCPSCPNSIRYYNMLAYGTILGTVVLCRHSLLLWVQIAFPGIWPYIVVHKIVYFLHCIQYLAQVTPIGRINWASLWDGIALRSQKVNGNRKWMAKCDWLSNLFLPVEALCPSVHNHKRFLPF